MEGEETEVESDPAWMAENSSEYNMVAHSMIQKTSARLEFKASLHTKNREMVCILGSQGGIFETLGIC